MNMTNISYGTKDTIEEIDFLKTKCVFKGWGFRGEILWGSHKFH